MSLTATLREINTDLSSYVNRPTSDPGSAVSHPLVSFMHVLFSDSANEQDVETACLGFIREWSGHPVRRRCARFGLNLHAIKHLPEVSGQVSYWNDLCRDRHETTFDQWYTDYLEYARGEWYALPRTA